jgi:3-hydroxybutyryl-CoA dehydrogenase
VLVVGAGHMGSGIAQVVAASGRRVSLHDAAPGAVERGLEAAAKSLGRLAEKGGPAPQEVLGRIEGVAELLPADLMIEAVVEDAAVKTDVFRRADELFPPHGVLASNTSSIPITSLAAATRRPDRVVGMHFFNPVHIMRLVEVVRGRDTSDETVQTACEVGRRMKKEPITVRDVPGFASSRLGVALGLEAMRMLEQGVASARDIDTAMELGYNHPMGPLRLTDLVGLDVRLAIAEYLHAELSSETFRPPEILRRMVGEGKLGKKAGEGFYTWDD